MCMEASMKEQPLNPPDIEYDETEEDTENMARAEMRRENENDARRKGEW